MVCIHHTTSIEQPMLHHQLYLLSILFLSIDPGGHSNMHDNINDKMKLKEKP